MKRCEMCLLESGESFYSTAWCEMWSGRIFQRINFTFEGKKIKNKFFRHATYAKEIWEKLRRQYFEIPEVEKFRKSFITCVSKLGSWVWGCCETWGWNVQRGRWKREKNLRENLFFHARDSRRKSFSLPTVATAAEHIIFQRNFLRFPPSPSSEIKRWKKRSETRVGWVSGWEKGKIKRRTSDFQNGSAKRFGRDAYFALCWVVIISCNLDCKSLIFQWITEGV